MAEVVGMLAANDIAIEYMYAFIEKHENEGYIVMRIEAEGAAVKLLTEHGFTGMEE